MRVAHLSTYDAAGGAARAAYRLHTGLRSLGHESRMLALYKTSTDPTVVRFEPPQNLPTRLRRGLKRRMLERAGSELTTRPAGSTFFTDDRSQHGADALRQLPASDVLNLHWIAGFIDYKAFFRRLPHGLPVVWTLHDMNAFTGGCHHAADCEGFRARCGACPQLGSGVEDDLSRRIWNRKRRAYGFVAEGGLSFVTPSRWLAGKLKESSLVGALGVNVIPYGLDTEIFIPRNVQVAREALGIPQGGLVILFASYSARDGYKGYPLLLEALARMRPDPKIRAITVGEGRFDTRPKSAVPIQSLGFMKDEERMSLVYSAADLFVLPSLQDNFPNTALEALACGVPTVAFHVGGVPEIVRSGLTGLTVSPGDPLALARAMEDLLGDPDRRATISSNCRRVAVEEYSLKTQAEQYINLYGRMLQRD